ncbi:MAG: hypothetical protein MMC23_004120 [Stictis urceolatum]|nr:hypothetical protein [Stictis urceolata]
MADSMKPKTFNPSNVPTPPSTYNQVAVTPLVPGSKLVTLAGQTGIDPSTRNISSVLVDQVRVAYTNVSNCLKAAGATPRDIIHVRHYIVQSTGSTETDSVEVVERGWGPLWEEFMDGEADGHRPPDTVLGVASLAKKALLYEVEVWAIVQS